MIVLYTTDIGDYMINKKYLKNLYEQGAVNIFQSGKKVSNLRVDKEDNENEISINIGFDESTGDFISSISYKDLRNFNSYDIYFKRFRLIDLIVVANYDLSIPMSKWSEFVDVIVSNIVPNKNNYYIGNKKFMCASLVRNKKFCNKQDFCLKGTCFYGKNEKSFSELDKLFNDVFEINNLKENKNKTF